MVCTEWFGIVRGVQRSADLPRTNTGQNRKKPKILDNWIKWNWRQTRKLKPQLPHVVSETRSEELWVEGKLEGQKLWENGLPRD